MNGKIKCEKVGFIILERLDMTGFRVYDSKMNNYGTFLLLETFTELFARYGSDLILNKGGKGQ